METDTFGWATVAEMNREIEDLKTRLAAVDRHLADIEGYNAAVDKHNKGLTDAGTESGQ